MKRFSLIYKIIIIYIVANLIIFVPLNRYIFKNIDSFYTFFQNSNRLFKYDQMPNLSMKSHWINDYRDAGDNIIVVGDSTVEDFYVKYEDSICGLLDRRLFNDERPHVFNFGSSGTKSVYVMERIKKAASYNPDLIIWQMGAGSFTEIEWAFPFDAKGFDISLGGNLPAAYNNVFKINNENGYFISRELRSSLVPLHRYSDFYPILVDGLKAKSVGVAPAFPNEKHMKVQIGDVKVTEKFYGIPFDESTRYFDVVGEVCKFVTDRGIGLMIYIAPINQSIMNQKYEAGYYDKLYDVVKNYADAYYVPVLNIYNVVPDELFIDGGHLKEEGDSIVAGKLYDFVVENFPKVAGD